MSDTPQAPRGPEQRPEPPVTPPSGEAAGTDDLPSEDRGASGRPELRPMRLGEMIDRTIKLYQGQLAVLAGIVAIIMVPWTLLVYALSQSESVLSDVLVFAVGVAIGPLVSGAVAWAAAEVYLGEQPTVGETYRYIGRRIWPVVGVSLLTALALILGFLALIIPGFILMARLFAATIAVVIEDRGVTDAMRRSSDLVKGSTGRVLGYLIVMGVIVGIGGMILGGLSFLFDSEAAVLVLDLISSVVLTPLSAVFGVLLYFDLRIRKEAFDLEVMARELTDGT